MRRSALLLATMALAILLASGVAQAIINGEPDGQRHPYVGALVTKLDGANLVICTGTLISPRVFLTAGHCTDAIRDEGLPTFVSFDPTFDQDSALVGGKSYVFPRYRQVPGNGLPEFDAYDVGVVVLHRPVDTAKGYGRLPEANLVERLERGQRLSAVGYGASGFDVGGGQPEPVYRDVRCRATLRLVDIENRVADMFVKLSGASAGSGGEGTCFGDSGGPIFLPDQRTVVANNSFVNNTRCAGGLPTPSGWTSRRCCAGCGRSPGLPEPRSPSSPRSASGSPRTANRYGVGACAPGPLALSFLFTQHRTSGLLRISPKRRSEKFAERAGPPFARRRVACDTGPFAPYYQG
jgi:hypothetical protein